MRLSGLCDGGLELKFGFSLIQAADRLKVHRRLAHPDLDATGRPPDLPDESVQDAFTALGLCGIDDLVASISFKKFFINFFRSFRSLLSGSPDSLTGSPFWLRSARLRREAALGL